MNNGDNSIRAKIFNNKKKKNIFTRPNDPKALFSEIEEDCKYPQGCSVHKKGIPCQEA